MRHEIADLKHISTLPGVYKMLDAQGDVLYVGKAINLNKRVASYFKKTVDSTKTRALVSHIASVEVTVTHTETEALILESSWIKLFRPKYNILMRDDKSYPYIYISDHPVFPNISVIRRKKKPTTGQCFGPYPNANAVRETMNIIHKVFHIRNCNDVYFNARSRPCLQFQINRCSAPCTHFISPEAYQHSVRDAKQFLQGKSQQILETMEARMQALVVNLAFEEAAILRDQIQYLRRVQEQQPIQSANRDADIVVLVAQPGFACVQSVQVRGGAVVASEQFFPSVPELGLETFPDDNALWQQVFAAFLTQRYFDTPGSIPGMIVTDRPVMEGDALQQALSTLRGKHCEIRHGKRGLPARWLEFAHNNLQQALAKHQLATETMQLRLKALATFLDLDHDIQRIDCFDVSHFQGEATVASCVVFDIKGPCKREYRRFNIHDVTAGDDYAAMEQALLRRFQKPDNPLPDVLIIDGGLGQVSVARRVLAMLNKKSITLLGVAKGPSRKSGVEQLILACGRSDHTLPENSPARHVIQHIRDEAHRFAITAHRKQRNKTGMKDRLEDIEGIGPKRRKALLQRFGSVRELSKASVEELTKVSGISKELAKKIQALNKL
jgi:excinuclease ABC subunit C